jgi:hypothetical protein
MQDHRYQIDRDLNEAEAMAKGLERYIHQDALYGSVGGFGFFSPSSMPSLTIGALMMRLRRLDDLNERGELSDRQAARLDEINAMNRAAFDDHHKTYTHKMSREVKSRLKAMSQFFEECFNDPKNCNRNYRPEAMRRTIVQELLIALDEIGIDQDEETHKLLREKDALLHRYANEKIDFLLDDKLEPVYPKQTFWWLYQRPHTPEK